VLLVVDLLLFLACASNIFAVLGLRSLFFLLKGAVDKFDYLQQGIAIVLIFIGVKMLIEYFGIHINIFISLGVILFVPSLIAPDSAR
jgi:tellurite resistance protein TerC